MSKNTTPFVIAILACLVCVFGWMYLPNMQSAQRRVDSQAAEHLERARRMLHQYSFGLTQKAVLFDQAYELGMDAEEENGAWIADEEADNYQAVYQRLWDGYPPTNWTSDPPRPDRANYGNLTGQISKGLSVRAKMLQDNEQLIEDALREVGEALAITDGSANSRDYAEANRLQAVALYHQGLTHSLRAKLKRNEAQPIRGQLVQLGSEIETLKSVEADDRIKVTNEKISELQNKASEAKVESDELAATLVKLDKTMADFNHRIDQAKKTRDARLAEMKSLRKTGLDFNNPDGAEDFAKKYQKVGIAFRSADRLVQTLVGGDLPHAQIDASSDYIHGQYLEHGTGGELSVTLGLSHYVHQREVLSSQVSAAKSTMTVFEDGISTLEGMLAMYDQQRSEARQQLPALTKKASDLYDELMSLDDEASAYEDDALDSLRKSASSARLAASTSNAKKWVNEARAITQSLTPEAKALSPFQTRTQDGWMAGHITAQQADALLEQARIYQHRYRVLKLDAAILADVAQPLKLQEADIQSMNESALQAQSSGVEAIKTAMTRLQEAHREANRHWTFVAQEASANELLVLLDQPGYENEALSAYRNAIKGRETESFSIPFQARINQLDSN